MSSDKQARITIVMMIDIVNFSSMAEDDQLYAIERLTRIVQDGRSNLGLGENDALFLPTGDGIAVCFREYVDIPLRFAAFIHQQYGLDRNTLKIGIHSGIVFQYNDIRGNINVAGSGINLAERVTSCCSGGHILVADQPAEMLLRTTWESKLFGRMRFIVKNNRYLHAYNFIDGEEIGNKNEPSRNRVFEQESVDLAERIVKRSVRRVDESERKLLPSLRAKKFLGQSIMIDHAVLRASINGFAGVPLDRVVVRHPKDANSINRTVDEIADIQIPVPKENRRKAFLEEFAPPLSDEGSTLQLWLGETDFWTCERIRLGAKTLHACLERGNSVLGEMALPLQTHMLIITADKKILLCLRSKHVIGEKETWMASIGEGFDGNKDRDVGGNFSVIHCVTRGLKEETGVDLGKDLFASDVVCVAISMEWHYMRQVLLFVVRLPALTSTQLSDRILISEDKEHSIVDYLDLNLGNCLDSVLRGTHALNDGIGSPARINSTSRLMLLVGALNEFGYFQVEAYLEALSLKRS